MTRRPCSATAINEGRYPLIGSGALRSECCARYTDHRVKEKVQKLTYRESKMARSIGYARRSKRWCREPERL
jgi:hypothetical protein